MIGSKELCDQAGITHRQLLHWIERGYVTPTRGHGGYGTRYEWDEFAAARVIMVARRVEWGMTPEAAARTEDPKLPAAPSPVVVAAMVAGRRAVREALRDLQNVEIAMT